MIALGVCDVTVAFGGVAAVEDLSFTVASGESVGVIGPNGAGKTTLLNAISGFAPISRGSVEVSQVDMTRWGASRRARHGVGRAFQTPQLVAGLTLAQNVSIGTTDRRRSIRSPNSPLDLLRLVGLEHRADTDAGALTLAERRLADIARALAVVPDILLLDEPATGLREHDVEMLIACLADIRSVFGVAMLIVSHDMQLVHGACTRIVVLDRGRLLAEGSPQEIVHNDFVVAAYFGEELPG